MGLVNIKFRSHIIQINTDNEQRVKEVVQKLDERIENNSPFKSSGDTKLLYLTALTLQDEVDHLKTELATHKAKQAKESEDTQRVISDTLNYVAGYIENLAEKLEK